jgi:catechol 2,3-dioxygenase-like lactoylglutathione lyase family enzyme
MHIHVGVDNIDDSVSFYTALFGAQPVKHKPDYAKWMLDDPQVNFAISSRSGKQGLDHLGIQVDSESELAQMRQRISQAEINVVDEGETVCCYAESDKSWVQDPSGIAWEAYHTMGDAQLFSQASAEKESACCAPVNIPVVAAEETCCDSSDNTNSGCC